MTGGDDYELLFTVGPRHRKPFAAVRRQAGRLRLTRIGIVRREPGVVVRRDWAVLPVPAGFEHFQ
jgi:thiamine monophosphate kinase